VRVDLGKGKVQGKAAVEGAIYVRGLLLQLIQVADFELPRYSISEDLLGLHVDYAEAVLKFYLVYSDLNRLLPNV